MWHSCVVGEAKTWFLLSMYRLWTIEQDNNQEQISYSQGSWCDGSIAFQDRSKTRLIQNPD